LSAPSALRGYAAFALASGYFCHEFVQRVATSVVVGDLMAAFAVGGTVLGTLSAIYFYAYAGMQIPVGVLIDRYGSRRLMSAAAALSALGALVFATAPAVEVAYVGRAMIGLGASFAWIGCLTVATLWLPPTRFALLVGLAQAGGMLGGMLGQAPLAVLVAALGWRWALGALAAVGALIAIGLFAAIPEAKPHHAAQMRPKLAAGLRIAAKNPQTWLHALYGLAMTGTMLSFAGLWAVPWFQTVHGYSRAAAAGLASSMFLGWAVGAPLIGLLADRTRRPKPIMVGGGLAMTASLLLLLYLPALSPTLSVALLFFNGLCAVSMILSYGAARAGNPPEASGAVLGIVNTGVVGSGALFQPLIGALLDANWHGAMADGARVYDADAYALAFGVLPAMALIGTLAAWRARGLNSSP
jgi:MFS family permease